MTCATRQLGESEEPMAQRVSSRRGPSRFIRRNVFEDDDNGEGDSQPDREREGWIDEKSQQHV